MMKICKACGKEFETNNFKKSYCQNPHPATCVICGKTFLKQNSSNKQTCSTECSKILMKDSQKNTMLERYGVEHNLQLPEVREKNRQRLLNKDTQDYFKSIVNEKYGVSNVSQLDWVQKAKIKTYIERYNTTHPWKNIEIQNKMKSNNIQKYGTPHHTQNQEIRKKIENTNLQKYGNKCPLKNPQVLSKIRNTVQNKYGCSSVALLHIKNVSDFENLSCYLENRKCTLSELSEYFGVSVKNMRRKIIKSNLQDKVMDFYSYSIPELKIKQILDDLEVYYEVHYRKLIYPYEVDFYLPEHKVAIEVNPTFTHNSDRHPDNYHYKKWKMCLNKGVRLISVFESVSETLIKDLITNSISPLSDFELRETKAKSIHKSFLKAYSIKCSTKVIEVLENKQLIGVCLIKSGYIEPVILKQSDLLFKKLCELGKVKINNNYYSWKLGEYIPESFYHKNYKIDTVGYTKL